MTPIHIEDIGSAKRALMSQLLHAKEYLETFEQELEKIENGSCIAEMDSFRKVISTCHFIDLYSTNLSEMGYMPIKRYLTDAEKLKR